MGEIRSSEVVTKKLRILRHSPSGIYDNLNLFVRGDRGKIIAYGNPMVFVKIGNNTIKAHHRHFASPFETKFNPVDDNVWEAVVQTDKFYLHDLIIEHMRNNRDIHYNVQWQLDCVIKKDSVVKWLHENCLELSRIDVEIKEAWENQERKFAESVQDHLRKNLPKSKKAFQDKLLRHLSKYNKQAFIGMSPKHMAQMFMAGANDPNIFREFARFCHRNSKDSDLVDESDFKRAMELFEVSEIMNK